MTQSTRLLLVASEPTMQRHVQLLLDAHEFVVVAVAGAAQARRLLRAESFDGVVVDASRATGMRTLAELCASPSLGAGEGALSAGFDSLPPDRAAGPPLLAVVDASAPEAVARAISHGADDVVESEHLQTLLVHRLGALIRVAQNDRARAPGVPAAPTDGLLRRAGRRKTDVLVGRSARMLAMADQMDMVAKTDIGVAIYGETGTGKDLVARTIHAASPRAGKPLVVANCTALPEALFENELFGHERGAFTGADSRQEGLLREAVGGTLVLDEIGDLGSSVQSKLLRLLQFREYKMVGGSKTLHADVRILATTHRDLDKAVAEQRFRQDLYYRLNTLQLTLPALRERLDDNPLLVDHFVALFNEREGRDFYGFTPAAIRALQRHSWPGNVRELESVVYRSLVMAGSRRLLDAADLQLGVVPGASALDLRRPFAELKAEAVQGFERAYLEALLRDVRGNLSQAARRAKHERKSLWRLCQRHGLDPKRFRERKG